MALLRPTGRVRARLFRVRQDRVLSPQELHLHRHVLLPLLRQEQAPDFRERAATIARVRAEPMIAHAAEKRASAAR